MANITTQKLDFIEPEEDKPRLQANADYPFISIDHRRFEKLCSRIYQVEIEHGDWKNQFDEIRLMSGVRDGGKDCALYISGNLTAVIQCKHSENDTALSVPIFAKEVIKFALYCQVETIVKTPSNFTYFIASSSGFNQECLDLISDFKNEITNQSSFEQWTKSIIASTAALKHVVYNEVESKLKMFFKDIKVVKIDKDELNRVLNKPYQIETVKAFFELKSVIDESMIRPFITEAKKIVSFLEAPSQPGISPEKVEETFEDASQFLKNWVSYISDIQKIHIDRPEVQTVIDWIMTPLQEMEKPIAIISGDGGCGKTVVMKDVYERLHREGIPVLGIKCDRYYTLDIENLEKAMGFPMPLHEMLEILLTKHSLVVILIDQIDAISQALSTNRKYLDTYLLLIQKLIRISGIRVVLSARKFDLTYDPNLSGLKSNKSIEIGQLTVDDVKSILKSLNINVSSIPDRLLQILRIPNNLRVFSDIYNVALSLEGIGELQDLYNELWVQKIISKYPNSEQSKTYISCLYEIANQMNSVQEIVADRSKFDDSYFNEINYLLSSGILIQSGKSLQFFHQTFYDYVYARHFVEQGNDLYLYVIDNVQTLHVRSSIKMILSYLRSADEEKYINSLKRLINSSSIRFHVKLLIVNNLGYSLKPLESELVFARDHILNSGKLSVPFLESVFGTSWIDFLIQNGILDRLTKEREGIIDRILKIQTRYKTPLINFLSNNFNFQEYETRRIASINLLHSILARSLPDGRKIIAKYLLEASFSGSEWIIPRILYLCKIWDYPEIFLLFEKHRGTIQNDVFLYCNILEDIAPFNLDLVIKEFQQKVIEESTKSGNRHKISSLDNQLIQLFKTITKLDQGKAFDAGLKIVRSLSISAKTGLNLSENDLYDDLVFWMYDYDKDQQDYEKNIYSEVIEIAETLAVKEDPKFYRFVDDSINDNSIAILKILIYAFYANPNLYSKQICDFVEVFNRKLGFNSEGKIHYWIRKLVGKVYFALSQAEKNIINEVFLSISSPLELRRRGAYGYRKYLYLTAIPEDQILLQDQLRRTYQELKRKFAKVSDPEPNRIYTHPVGPPLDTKAYENMTFEQWENSFKKYDSDNNFEFGLVEHSRAFCDIVKKKPEIFITFVERLIRENNVRPDYWIKGLEGLKAANYNPSEVVTLYKMAIAIPLEDPNTLYLVWLADFFAHHRMIDTVIIDFLVSQGNNHEDPESTRHVNDPLTDGINSVRGAALDRLFMCTYSAVFSEKIFLAAETASNDPVASVRAVLVAHLANLIRYDKQRSIDIFLKTMELEVDPNLVKASVQSLQYFVHHGFEHFVPYLKKWINHVPIQEDFGAILISCWVRGYKGSERLMNLVFKMSDNARAKAVRMSYENLFDDDDIVRKKCDLLFLRFLNDKSRNVVDQYDHMFLHLKDAAYFENWLPYITKYSRSRSARKNPHYFLEYLLKSSAQHPIECIDLLSNLKNLPRPNISAGPYYEDEPIKIVLSCYNVLNNSGEKEYLKKSIKMFDSMLQIDFLRQQASKALSLVER